MLSVLTTSQRCVVVSDQWKIALATLIPKTRNVSKPNDLRQHIDKFNILSTKQPQFLSRFECVSACGCENGGWYDFIGFSQGV